MRDRRITEHGQFQVATAIGVDGKAVAWAKVGLILANDPIQEPGEPVWFAFGSTHDEARSRILMELGLAN